MQENVQERDNAADGSSGKRGLGFLRLLLYQRVVVGSPAKMVAFVCARARSRLVLIMVVPPRPYVVSHRSLLHSLLLLTSLKDV